MLGLPSSPSSCRWMGVLQRGRAGSSMYMCFSTELAGRSGDVVAAAKVRLDRTQQVLLLAGFWGLTLMPEG
jgi:hypothetical protein